LYSAIKASDKELLNSAHLRGPTARVRDDPVWNIGAVAQQFKDFPGRSDRKPWF
jgi:hypothetical protein